MAHHPYDPELRDVVKPPRWKLGDTFEIRHEPHNLFVQAVPESPNGGCDRCFGLVNEGYMCEQLPSKCGEPTKARFVPACEVSQTLWAVHVLGGGE